MGSPKGAVFRATRSVSDEGDGQGKAILATGRRRLWCYSGVCAMCGKIGWVGDDGDAGGSCM